MPARPIFTAITNGLIATPISSCVCCLVRWLCVALVAWFRPLRFVVSSRRGARAASGLASSPLVPESVVVFPRVIPERASLFRDLSVAPIAFRPSRRVAPRARLAG
jgi:hypothetical protein